MHKPTRTLQDFLTELEAQAMTLADWARSKNFALSSVYAVVNGRNVGKRGEGRLVLQAMGLPLPPMHKNPRTAKPMAVAA